MTARPTVSIAVFALACAGIFAQTTPPSTPVKTPSNVVEVDASQPVPAPESGFLHLGGRSSTGHNLEINSRYLVLDGKPFLPVIGEFHFSRFPPQYWEEEILKMKTGGINVIATYVFWIHHEEIEGQFDWSGQRDLRHFVELCAKHGMYVYLRPGPWAHGEVRNGGFPDWVQAMPGIRTNDPTYLAHVARFDKEIATQLKGLLWKDGGPVIGSQIENEYGAHGPGKGAEHILKLKQLLIEAGIEVPLYSVTGWPSLDFPTHDVIPVSGGYPDGFWFGSLTNLPPSMNYLFNLNRQLGDMGATVPSEDPTGKVDLKHDPYFGAEEAGGMASSYHRRPLIDADDIAALTLTGIGSGLNLYGYYMFQGGANPPGKLSTLQESSATGYPNDLPQVNYDFQAPLGAYGQMRESFRRTKNMHLFLNAFGTELAQMRAVGPAAVPRDPGDVSVPRVAARTLGDRGYIFVNNYIRQTQMPQREGFQVKLKLPSGAVLIPANPIALPANSYVCWPVNLSMSGARLEYSTAQLLTKVETAKESVFVFFAVPGIPAEFSFAAESVQSVHAAGEPIRRAGSSVRLKVRQPGMNAFVEVLSKTGKHVRILVLTEEQAEATTVLHSADSDRLISSPADLFAEGNQLHIRSIDPAKLQVKVFPAVNSGPAQEKSATATKVGLWTEFDFKRSRIPVTWTWKKTKEAEAVDPVKMGPFTDWRNSAVALVPPGSAFDHAAEWQIHMVKPLPAGVSDLYLKIDYVGDIARVYTGKTLLDDDFFNGRAWEIGLKRYMPKVLESDLGLKILPLRKDAPIYLDPRTVAALPRQPQSALLRKITLEPEYEVLLTVR